ncbi:MULTISPECIES: hypothetical protein [Actinosynnema]|uniref:hypothetical protein n=1 Tax=Actinosynnema TaxID=40566 RepID=UPI0020A26850|nr:hypothetical protein [Actinosynnema pretiosum]MCP2098125.1 hypothetical protein [Actinosynnema pretiosum]
MDVLSHSSEAGITRVLTGLAAEFGDRLPESVVTGTVLQARRDLQGQIAPESLEELLHRLAHYRLRALPDAGTTTPA